MMTKMCLLLFQIKGWNNSFVEERLSTPMVSCILFGVILFVVLMRVFSWLQYLYLEHEVKKRIFEYEMTETETDLPALCIFGLKLGHTTDEMNRLAVWVYDVQLNMFDSLYNNALSKGGMSYEAGLSMIHPDDREVFVNDMHWLSSGLIERMTELLRFYRNGKYELYRFNAVALRSVVTGEVDKIIGTEECICNQMEKYSG